MRLKVTLNILNQQYNILQSVISVSAKGHCRNYSHKAVNKGAVQPILEFVRPGPSTKFNETLCVQCILDTKTGSIMKHFKKPFVF